MANHTGLLSAERRKLANKPEVISVDELKSLLVLTRQHFLDHFDADVPKTILIKTDKTSNMLNGKFYVTLNISSFHMCGIYASYLLLKLIKCIDQNISYKFK